MVAALREILPNAEGLTATTDLLRDAAARADVVGRPPFTGSTAACACSPELVDDGRIWVPQ